MPIIDDRFTPNDHIANAVSGQPHEKFADIPGKRSWGHRLECSPSTGTFRVARTSGEFVP
jgi:hypothetical protein